MASRYRALRQPTIRDVADRAGVSTATVSRVLSGALEARPATQQRVLDAVRELGYRPSGIARSLKLQTTGTFGLIVTDILNPFFPELVRAIEDAARERGYAVLLGNGDEDPDREATYLEVLAERRVDGLIVASGGLSERHGRWLRNAPIPVVLVNCELADGSRPAVLTDNRGAARLAAEHVIGLGHRRIGHITGRPTNAATSERIAGIRDAIGAVGVDEPTLALAEGDGHVAGGESAMSDLLARPVPPTAVLCYNDLTAIGAIQAVRGRGLHVPADVSITGFDDIDLAAWVDPPLTTVSQAIAEIGRASVHALVETLAPAADTATDAVTGSEDGEDLAPARVLRLPATLRVRSSTGPPPV
jgi:DNA-binding LacI/PurR family transcriptional regulator